MKKCTRYFVYVDCTIEKHPRAYYVGKGVFQRVNALERNELHTERKKSFGIKRVIVFETLDERLALAREVELISLLGTFHYENKFGCNKTRGGDGTTEAANIRWEDPRERQKISDGVTNKWQNEKYRKTQYEAARKKWKNEEYRAVRKSAMKELWTDNTYVALMSNNMKERRKDHEFQAKLKAGQDRNNVKRRADKLLKIEQMILAKDERKRKKREKREQKQKLIDDTREERIKAQLENASKRMIDRNKDPEFKKQQIVGRNLRKVYQIDLVTDEIVTMYDSVAQAAQKLNVSVSLILNRIQRQHLRPYHIFPDFTFRYVEQTEK